MGIYRKGRIMNLSAATHPPFHNFLLHTSYLHRLFKLKTEIFRFGPVLSLLQFSSLAATGFRSTAWRACALPSSPPRRRNTTCRWPTPATTCWTCPAIRPKRSSAVASPRPWSSTRALAWSEGQRCTDAWRHFNSNTPSQKTGSFTTPVVFNCFGNFLTFYMQEETKTAKTNHQIPEKVEKLWRWQIFGFSIVFFPQLCILY